MKGKLDLLLVPPLIGPQMGPNLIGPMHGSSRTDSLQDQIYPLPSAFSDHNPFASFAELATLRDQAHAMLLLVLLPKQAM